MSNARRHAHVRTRADNASQRHTAPNIKKWTDEALDDIGLTPAKVLAP